MNDMDMDVDRLAKLPLFGELDYHDLAHVAGWVTERRFAEGDVLIEEGGLPTDVFLVESGTVDVTHEEQLIASLGAGDIVGEIALIDPQRRTATVTATSAVRAVALNVEDFASMDAEMPEITKQLREIAERRRER
jgi:CRP/FNR family transcriptional regulator, cyclic AMP receptor protein